MAGRLGTARLEALLENLDRALNLEGSDLTVESLVADNGITCTAGQFKAGGTATGVEGITHSSSITATSGNDFFSGAMAIPAHAIITDVGVVVTAEITQGSSGKMGFKAGDSADSADIVTEDDDALHAGSATLAVGKGVSLIATDRVGLGGAATPVLGAGKAYAASARDIHATVTTQHTLSAGTVRFWVKYMHIEG